jgi:hypothetical protein
MYFLRKSSERFAFQSLMMFSTRLGVGVGVGERAGAEGAAAPEAGVSAGCCPSIALETRAARINPFVHFIDIPPFSKQLSTWKPLVFPSRDESGRGLSK